MLHVCALRRDSRSLLPVRVMLGCRLHRMLLKKDRTARQVGQRSLVLAADLSVVLEVHFSELERGAAGIGVASPICRARTAVYVWDSGSRISAIMDII